MQLRCALALLEGLAFLFQLLFSLEKKGSEVEQGGGSFVHQLTDLLADIGSWVWRCSTETWRNTLSCALPDKAKGLCFLTREGRISEHESFCQV